MSSKTTLEDFKVPIKIRLAALWASVIFCYIYGDFFTLFVPGRIERLNTGHSGVGETTPQMILIFAILMTIPALMPFLSVSLPAKINRWLNIIFGVFFTALMILVVSTSIDKWWLFYTYLGIVEIILTSLIVIFAWSWERVE